MSTSLYLFFDATNSTDTLPSALRGAIVPEYSFWDQPMGTIRAPGDYREGVLSPELALPMAALAALVAVCNCWYLARVVAVGEKPGPSPIPVVGKRTSRWPSPARRAFPAVRRSRSRSFCRRWTSASACSNSGTCSSWMMSRSRACRVIGSPAFIHAAPA